MKIAVIGTGYVGLVTGVCLADIGHNVICVDNDNKKLNMLKQGISPIYEPGLEELIKYNIKENRLFFTSDIGNSVKTSDVCFITVGTPQDADGAVNLQDIYDVTKQIAKSINEYKVIVNKSTVPIGTSDELIKIIKQYTNSQFDVVSNPEFLKQGNAVNDFLYPDRIILGSNSQKAIKIMKEIYTPLFCKGERIITMDTKSAEMTKYAANSFLATKISFINEISNLCNKVGAEIEKVRIGISADSRIGNKFLFPGLGFGGSCFPKDIKGLIKIGEKYGYDMQIIKSVNHTNEMQRKIFTDKIFDRFGKNLSDRIFGVWGLSFKPRTDDVRQAPAITIIKSLLTAGATIKAYDPRAIKNAKNIFGDSVIFTDNMYEICKNADGILLCTEWNEFRYPDFDKIKLNMKTPVIFDGRNLYNTETLEEKGFEYYHM